MHNNAQLCHNQCNNHATSKYIYKGQEFQQNNPPSLYPPLSVDNKMTTPIQAQFPFITKLLPFIKEDHQDFTLTELKANTIPVDLLPLAYQYKGQMMQLGFDRKRALRHICGTFIPYLLSHHH